MSYLKLPRIQFGGLFFTAPSTINNLQPNYHENVPLTNSEGQYLPNALWNATGVAQLWLSECKVLSVVGPDGTLHESGSSDPIVGATVETPSPSTPKQTADGEGLLDIAKLVDLDPLQQGRTRGYGLHVFVTLPGGGGFSGPLTPPELRYMYTRVTPPPKSGGSWYLVGNWQTAIPKDKVNWFGDFSSSPFLQHFKSACSEGVSFKVAIDLHQNDPTTRFTQGDMFCYGRATGALGPAQIGELEQVVPGRVLYTSKPAQPQAEAADVSTTPSEDGTPIEGAMKEHLMSRIGKTMDEMGQSTGEIPLESGVIQAQAADPLYPWNPGFAQAQQITVNKSGTPETFHVLSLDLSFAIRLQKSPGGGALGKFEVNSGITVGYITGSSSSDFQPLHNGAVNFEEKYTWLDSDNKKCYLVDTSGIVDIRLESQEVGPVGTNPLAVHLHGYGLMIQEPEQGYFIDLSRDSLRLDSTEAQQIQVMVRQFGRPVVGERPPVRWGVYTLDSQSQQNPVSSNKIQVNWVSKTDNHGLATMQVQATASDLPIPSPRDPLDSLMFFVILQGTAGQPISDSSYMPLSLSLLYWPAYSAPANPTWDADVQPILFAYARLYPGMKGRLDISDETTVKGFANAMYGRMDPAIFNDPAYMPVTRDLAPSKAKMIRKWLEPYVKT